MTIALTILQVLIAIHTLMGAVWKFMNSEQTVPSLTALPHAAWLGLAAMEILAVGALLLPLAMERLWFLVPIAAACIAAEMLLFIALQFRSGLGEQGQIFYWLIVALVCGLLAIGRILVN